MITCQAKVILNREVKPGYYLLRLVSPEIARKALPGQFALLRCSTKDLTDPLLRRPLSFHNVTKEQGEISFLYQVKGKGTKELTRFVPGDTVDTMGPLGKGFQLEPTKGPIAIIAGGVGVAPLVYLACMAHDKGNTVYTFLGARSTESLLADPDLVRASTRFFAATDDGTEGFCGNIIELLHKETNHLATCTAAYICGPEPVMAAAVSLCAKVGIPCQVSLESTMACGVGACLGCTCRTTGSHNYSRVCTEGPVFDGREVILDEKP